MKKYDERNTLFARVGLQEGTKEYEEFYNRNPKTKFDDDESRDRSFRNQLRKSDRFKELFFPLIQNNKKIIKGVHDLTVQHPVAEKRLDIEDSFRENIKEITKYFGASNVGIAKLNDLSYYSHQGGLAAHVNLQTYNVEVKPSYSTAIVFTVEMDKDKMNRAPMYEELLATEIAYVKVAEIGSKLTMYLKDLGYRAEMNHSEFYLAPMVPLAVDAGLGQIGMCNHIVTKEHGNRVRLGAVFTTLKLSEDQPVDFGLTEFCKKCALCLLNCPSKAITHKPRMVNGRQFYKFDDNKCYEMWLRSGTDCGTCISACPFSQGVDLEKLDKIKEQPELIDQIMEEHYAKHGRRVFTKKDLPIVKIGDKK
jgi:epoxyqueuosine reductase QueG